MGLGILPLAFIFLFLGSCSDGGFDWNWNSNDPNAKFTIDVLGIGKVTKNGAPVPNIKGRLCYPPSEIANNYPMVFWCHPVETNAEGVFEFNVSANLPLTKFIFTWGMDVSMEARRLMLSYDGKWYDSHLSSVKEHADSSYLKFINVMAHFEDLGNGKRGGTKVQSPYRTSNPNDVGYILKVYVEYDLGRTSVKSFIGGPNQETLMNFKANQDIDTVPTVEVIDTNRQSTIDGKTYWIEFTEQNSAQKPK